jgi:hypothetical protein
VVQRIQKAANIAHVHVTSVCCVCSTQQEKKKKKTRKCKKERKEGSKKEDKNKTSDYPLPTLLPSFPQHSNYAIKTPNAELSSAYSEAEGNVVVEA